MQNNEKTDNRIKKVHIFLLAGGIFIISLLSWWIWGNFSSKPLGNELEYLGKQDYGCIISFCDSGPSATYYYATNMDLNKIESYFKQATFTGSTSDTNDRTRLDFQHSDTGFSIRYYLDASKAAFHSGKKGVVTVESTEYDIALRSL